jgi:putative oxidoreductase
MMMKTNNSRQGLHPLLKLWRLAEQGIAVLAMAQPLAQLAARWYLAGVFFRSGLTKIHDWDSTLALFANEYHVPLLNPVLAAWMGTTAELALPALLLFGLAGRFAAAGLFILNGVAVLSLPEVADAALQQHQFWGSLLLGLLLWGPGALSADRLLTPWLRRRLLATGGGSAGGKSGFAGINGIDGQGKSA